MKRLQSEIYEHRLSAQKAVCEVKNNYRIFIVNVFFFHTKLTVRIWCQPRSVAVALNAMEIKLGYRQA